MKVKELILELKGWDENAVVRITDPDCCGCRSKEVTHIVTYQVEPVMEGTPLTIDLE